MRINENVTSKVLKQLGAAYSHAGHQDFKEMFCSFCRTINAINTLDKDGEPIPYLTAENGLQYRASDYEILPDLEQLILPGKVGINNSLTAVNLRSVPHYSGEDPLKAYRIMSPNDFSSFQSIIYIRARLAVPQMRNVGDVQTMNYTLSDISNRFAVHEGFSTIIGAIAKFVTSPCVGDLMAKAPLAVYVPIVVGVFYEKQMVYNVQADDILADYFVKKLLLTK